jgi:hypothetical protein
MQRRISIIFLFFVFLFIFSFVIACQSSLKEFDAADVKAAEIQRDILDLVEYCKKFKDESLNLKLDSLLKKVTDLRQLLFNLGLAIKSSTLPPSFKTEFDNIISNILANINKKMNK